MLLSRGERTGIAQLSVTSFLVFAMIPPPPVLAVLEYTGVLFFTVFHRFSPSAPLQRPLQINVSLCSVLRKPNEELYNNRTS
jgi:hypothetical protein